MSPQIDRRDREAIRNRSVGNPDEGAPPLDLASATIRLRRVLNLHERQPQGFGREDACRACHYPYPCPTVQIIEAPE